MRDRELRFPSLTRGDIGYIADSDRMRFWDTSYHVGGWRSVALWAGQFATYGDGLTQHAPATIVPREHFADYCASLAGWLLDHPDDIEVVSWHVDAGPAVDRSTALFLYHLRADDPDARKPQLYYSLRERKTSRSESKRNDRR